LFKKVDGRLQARDLPHCMPVWRRELHAKHGFFDEAACGTSADWEFWLRAGEGGAGFLMVDEPLGVFLRHPSCYSRRDETQTDRDAAIAERYRHLLNGNTHGVPVGRPVNGDYLRRLHREGAALELIVQLAVRTLAEETADTTSRDRLVRELTGLPSAQDLEPLCDLGRTRGAALRQRLHAFIEGLARLSWGTDAAAVSPTAALPVFKGVCVDVLELTGNPEWLATYARLLGASGDGPGEQALLRALNLWNRSLDRRASDRG
jgi:hypothetical protein